jgi:hypothetical protein
LQAWDDPVSGLVTGAVYEPDRFTIQVAKPVEPDLSEVRRAVDAVLSAEEEPVRQPRIPAPRRQPTMAGDTPGMVPPNPRAGRPRSPSVRQLPGLRPRSGAPRREPPRAQKVRDQGRERSNSRGVGAVIVLILIFVVIVVVALSSLVNMITDLVG